VKSQLGHSDALSRIIVLDFFIAALSTFNSGISKFQYLPTAGKTSALEKGLGALRFLKRFFKRF